MGVHTLRMLTSFDLGLPSQLQSPLLPLCRPARDGVVNGDGNAEQFGCLFFCLFCIDMDFKAAVLNALLPYSLMFFWRLKPLNIWMWRRTSRKNT